MQQLARLCFLLCLALSLEARADPQVTLVAVVCTALENAPVCLEEIVTTSNISGITMQSCQMQAPMGLAKWQSEHPVYHSWKIRGRKCAPGKYEPKGRA